MQKKVHFGPQLTVYDMQQAWTAVAPVLRKTRRKKLC